MALGFKNGVLESINNVTIVTSNDQLSMVTVTPASLVAQVVTKNETAAPPAPVVN